MILVSVEILSCNIELEEIRLHIFEEVHPIGLVNELNNIHGQSSSMLAQFYAFSVRIYGFTLDQISASSFLTGISISHR